MHEINDPSTEDPKSGPKKIALEGRGGGGVGAERETLRIRGRIV